MDQWYIPITILPGVGLLIMSTSNLLSGLNVEISQLITEDCKLLERIIEKKIDQLTLLNISLVGQYLSAGCLLLSGILAALFSETQMQQTISGFIFMLIAVLLLLCSLILLIIFSYRAVKIKKDRFKIGLQKSIGKA